MDQRRTLRNKMYFEWNKNGNTTHPNGWDAAKVAGRGKFITLNKYIHKEERTKINNLSFYHRKSLKKESKLNSK